MSIGKWPEAMRSRLAALWPTGISAAQCAVILNAEFGTSLSRNSIIGQVHRHINKRKMHAHKRARDNSGHRKPKASPPPVIQEIRIAADPVPFVDRKPSQCPFPLWAHEAPTGGPDFLVCGSRRDGLDPYCKKHMALTHTTPRTRITADDRAKAAEASKATGMVRMFG